MRNLRSSLLLAVATKNQLYLTNLLPELDSEKSSFRDHVRHNLKLLAGAVVLETQFAIQEELFEFSYHTL